MKDVWMLMTSFGIRPGDDGMMDDGEGMYRMGNAAVVFNSRI